MTIFRVGGSNLFLSELIYITRDHIDQNSLRLHYTIRTRIKILLSAFLCFTTTRIWMQLIKPVGQGTCRHQREIKILPYLHVCRVCHDFCHSRKVIRPRAMHEHILLVNPKDPLIRTQYDGGFQSHITILGVKLTQIVELSPSKSPSN